MEGPIALPGRTSPLHLLIRLPFPVFFFWKMSLLCVCHHFPQHDTGLLSSGPERTVLGWCNKVDIFMGDHVKNKLKEDSRLFIEGSFFGCFFFFCLVLSCLVSIYSRSSCTFLKSWMLLEVIPQPPPVSDIFCMSQLIPLKIFFKNLFILSVFLKWYDQGFPDHSFKLSQNIVQGIVIRNDLPLTPVQNRSVRMSNIPFHNMKQCRSGPATEKSSEESHIFLHMVL